MDERVLSDEEFQLLASLLEERFGLSYGKEKAYLFSARLSSLMVELGCQSYFDLYQAIKRNEPGNVLDRVVDSMTTQETMWFRDPPVWAHLESVVLPELVERARQEHRRLWAWSCACSTGQEPYSLAMMADESPSLRNDGSWFGGGLSIVATDVSPAAIKITRDGRFSRIAMHRGNLGDRARRYFVTEGAVSILDERIRRLVRPSVFNLRDTMTGASLFDLVLCRNVLVYFSQEFRREVLGRISSAMRPGGFLVLGASEGLYGECDGFDLIERHGVIVYRRREGSVRA